MNYVDLSFLSRLFCAPVLSYLFGNLQVSQG